MPLVISRRLDAPPRLSGVPPQNHPRGSKQARSATTHLRCQAKARCRGRLPIALLFTRAEGSVGVGHVLGCRSASLLILWMDELRRVALRFRVAAAASGT